MLVSYNQHVVRDRTVADHVALGGWLATRLDDRLGLLTRGCRTAVPRHQTLRATLDWSYETLRRAERTDLCRLAVFTTTFDTQAACALMVDEEIKATDVPERLPDLAEQALLTVCWAGEQVLYRLRQPDDAWVFHSERLCIRVYPGLRGVRRVTYCLRGERRCRGVLDNG
jgi:hypothetical protein